MTVGHDFRFITTGQGNQIVSPDGPGGAAAPILIYLVNGRNLGASAVYVQLWQSSILLPEPPDPPPTPPPDQSLYVPAGATFSWADPNGGRLFNEDGGCVWAVTANPLDYDAGTAGIDVLIRVVGRQVG